MLRQTYGAMNLIKHFLLIEIHIFMALKFFDAFAIHYNTNLDTMYLL